MPSFGTKIRFIEKSFNHKFSENHAYENILLPIW